MVGVYCAVALCRNSYGKVGKDGIDDRISFHRLPANPTMRKKWVTLCKRSDKFNPSTSVICSEHFKPEDFVRDFQAELLGYTPKKRLHPDTIPTRNIPNDPNSTQTDSAVRRRKRMAEKKERMDHLDALNAGLQAERPSTSQQLDNYEEIDEPSLSFQEVVTSDYKLLYEEMKSKNSSLQEKVRAQTLKLKRANIHVKRLNRKTQTQKTKFTNKIKQLTILLKHHRAAKKEQNLTLKTAVKQLLEKKFTANEIELLTEKKNKVHWTSAEISKAFTLRYLGKRAYIYVRKTLQFPLPGLSSLQKWAKRINLRNGLLTDVLMVMKTAGNSMDNFSKLTVIMFDEMKIESTLEYDTLEDRIFGRHNQMQIIVSLSSSEGKGSFQYEYAQGDANTDALRYLAGWLAKKFIGEFNFGSPTCKTEKQEHDYAMPTWIHHLSYGGLIDPNENFFTKIKKLEKIFNKIYTEDFFFNEKKIVEKLTIKSIDKLGDNYLPMKVIKAFMKERIFIKMKYLNHSWEQELSKKRKGKAQLKSAKKMRKVCT